MTSFDRRIVPRGFVQERGGAGFRVRTRTAGRGAITRCDDRGGWELLEAEQDEVDSARTFEDRQA